MKQRNVCWTRPMAEIQASLCLLVILGVAPAVLIACRPIHFNPGTDVAPSDDPARVWIPPVSVASAKETKASLEELRALNLVPAQPSPAGNEYDLPTLVDVALRSNPQTKRAWYQIAYRFQVIARARVSGAEATLPRDELACRFTQEREYCNVLESKIDA